MFSPRDHLFSIWALGDRSKDTPVSRQMADTCHATEQQGSAGTKQQPDRKLIRRKAEHMRLTNLPDV